MKKKAFICVLAVAFAMGITATAIGLRATRITPTLTFSGTTATCEVRISAIGKEIDATLALWYGDTLVDSWSKSATSLLFISETHTVIRGRTYTLKVSGNIDGVAFTGLPVSATCR